MTAAARLAELAAAVLAGQVLDPADAAAVAAVLKQRAADAELTEPDTDDRRRALLRELKQRFYPGQDVRPAAREIARLWQRYAAVAWCRDHVHDTCPKRHAGTPNEIFFALMKLKRHALGHERVKQLLE